VEPGRQPVRSVGSALWISHHRAPATQGDLSSRQSQGVDRNNLGDSSRIFAPAMCEFSPKREPLPAGRAGHFAASRADG
jgi:hypothetical protein